MYFAAAENSATAKTPLMVSDPIFPLHSGLTPFFYWRLQMKRLATIGAVGTIMVLSVTPITIAHADPIMNDTLTITVNGAVTSCKLMDDSISGDVGETQCAFPVGFVPARGSVTLTEPDKSISDV